MLQTYQNLSGYMEPIALTIGSFSIRWYALMYLAGFAVTFFLLKWRIRHDIGAGKFPIFSAEAEQSPKKLQNLILDFLFYSMLGVIVGGRLGYVLFYDFSYFIKNPLEIILPFHIENFNPPAGGQISNLEFTGLYGMSYFGGLIGALCTSYIFARKNKLDFWVLANFVVPAVPAGYFFGRIGNFINGELYGRPTEKIWGMYFSADPNGLLRHPSQLYEAFFEGIVIFVVLWLLRNNKKLIDSHLLFPIYLFSYGFFRFWIEFFREPDSQIGLIFGLTLGQILSLALMAAAGGVYFVKRKRNML